jgi:hypothetical protein
MKQLNFNQTIKEFPQFYKTITSIDYQILKKLYMHAKKLHRNYEYQCNGANRDKLPRETWEEYDKFRNEQLILIDKLVDKLEIEATRFAESIDMLIYFQTDPRGLSIYLQRRGMPVVMNDNNYNTTCDICF